MFQKIKFKFEWNSLKYQIYKNLFPLKEVLFHGHLNLTIQNNFFISQKYFSYTRKG